MNLKRWTEVGWLSTYTLLAAITASQASAPRYHIIDLGIVGQDQADSMNGVRLNYLGHVTLTMMTGRRDSQRQPITHAFLWKNGKRLDLGVLPGYTSMIAADLNSQDAIVGSATKPIGNSLEPYAEGQTDRAHAFLWKAGKLKDIGPSDFILVSDKTSITGDSQAEAINDHGIVAGSFPVWLPMLPGDYATTPYMFLYRNGLWKSAGNGDAARINLQGDIAGTLPDAQHAVLFSHGRKRDLGTLSRRGKSAEGALVSEAHGLNREGVVVGNAQTDVLGNYETEVLSAHNANVIHAFLWRSGKMYDLDKGGGHQESGANAVNNHGLVVGYFIQERTECACLWKQGRRYDLSALVPVRSGWHLQIATDINDRGQIVGHGVYHGKEHAFLLTLR